MTLSYYRPSGRIPRAGIVAVAAAGLAAACAAVVYAWLMVKAASFGADLKALCFLLSLSLIWIWLDGLTRRAVALGKIRNPAWMKRAGAAIGLLAWYVQWTAWVVMSGVRASGGEIDLTVIESVVWLCLRPDELFVSAFIIPLSNASGVLKVGLVVCWLVEFCFHLLPPMLAGRERAAMPFCEASDQWARKIELEPVFEPVADTNAVQRLLEDDPGRFMSMLVPRTADPVGTHIRVTLYRCMGPDSFITVTHNEEIAPEEVPLPPEALGALVAVEPESGCFREHPVVELLRLPAPDAEALLRRWSGDDHPGMVPIKS
jgi:hypothetical protein